MSLLFTIGVLPGYVGVASLYACDVQFPAPVGFLWYRLVGKNMIEMLYIFVMDDFRRKKVATLLLGELLTRFPKHDIITGQASELSKPWLAKQGFSETKNGWLLKND